MVLKNLIPDSGNDSGKPSDEDSNELSAEEFDNIITHPTRAAIIKVLKKRGACTFGDLMASVCGDDYQPPEKGAKLSEADRRERFNLLHHLKILKNSCIVDDGQRSEEDGRLRIYRLIIPDQPKAAVVYISKDTIRDKLSKFKEVLEVVESIEAEEIPYPDKIKQAKIVFYYE